MKISSITGMRGDVRKFGNSNLLIDDTVDLGIEIELEDLKRYDHMKLDHPFWRVTNDGSLRNNGREFIMCLDEGHKLTPVRGSDFEQAIIAWNEWHTSYCANFDPPQATERTSVHVHVDVREMDVDHIAKFIMLYATFEPTLFKYLANNREDEIYCIPFSRNYQAKRRASEFINNINSKPVLQDTLHQSQKYESMNIHSILQRGSIEFRIHHGSTDTDEIVRWVNILLCLRRAALDDEIKLIDYPVYASDIGLMNFVGVVFKEHSHLIIDHIDEPLLLSGVRIAQDIQQLKLLKDLNKSFMASPLGKKAGDNSIMHKWAEVNARKIYLD